MRAAQLFGTEDLRITDVPEPTPGPGQVKLRNAYSGICGSDLHLYYMPGLDVNTFPVHPVTGAKLPQIIGHEFSGTVEEVGPGVTDFAKGDNVVVWPVYYCGNCAACQEGRYNACKTIGFHGITSHGGGMAEFTVVDSTMLHKLPDNVDLRLGALVEPMAVAWHAVSRGTVIAGQSALIAGAGPIGIGLWFALRANGVERVVISEPSPSRRATLEALGATTVDPINGDLAAAVERLTDGAGVDVAFDAAGVGPALTSAISSTRNGGRVVVVAVHEKPIDFAPGLIVNAEIDVVGSLAYLPADFAAVIDAMSEGFYDTTGWVDEIELDGITGAYQTLRSGEGAKFLVRSGLDSLDASHQLERSELAPTTK